MTPDPLFAERIEGLALAGAADDRRPDKSAWIRLWAAARRARGASADAEAWTVALAAQGDGALARAAAGAIGMSAPYDEAARQSAAWEAVMGLAHAHALAADGALQQDLYDTLLTYAQVEREALMAALVQEYAAVLAHADVWREQGRIVTWRARVGAARVALARVAERLGVTDLRAQAAAVVARGEDEEDEEGR